jgi:hypothetical protein
MGWILVLMTALALVGWGCVIVCDQSWRMRAKDQLAVLEAERGQWAKEADDYRGRLRDAGGHRRRGDARRHRHPRRVEHLRGHRGGHGRRRHVGRGGAPRGHRRGPDLVASGLGPIGSVKSSTCPSIRFIKIAEALLAIKEKDLSLD